MKKDKTTIQSVTENQFWQPTLKLRFFRREGKCTEDSINIETVLQQLHTSNLGNTEWRDIPTEIES